MVHCIGRTHRLVFFGSQNNTPIWVPLYAPPPDLYPPIGWVGGGVSGSVFFSFREGWQLRLDPAYKKKHQRTLFFFPFRRKQRPNLGHKTTIPNNSSKATDCIHKWLNTLLKVCQGFWTEQKPRSRQVLYSVAHEADASSKGKKKTKCFQRTRARLITSPHSKKGSIGRPRTKGQLRGREAGYNHWL